MLQIIVLGHDIVAISRFPFERLIWIPRGSSISGLGSDGLLPNRWQRGRAEIDGKESHDRSNNQHDFGFQWLPIMSWRRNKLLRAESLPLNSELKRITRVNDKTQIFNQLKTFSPDIRPLTSSSKLFLRSLCLRSPNIFLSSLRLRPRLLGSEHVCTC